MRDGSGPSIEGGSEPKPLCSITGTITVGQLWPVLQKACYVDLLKTNAMETSFILLTTAA